jgi:hypothetical protein
VKPITLPCGTPAQVVPFNGRVQELLIDEEVIKKAEHLDLVLRDVTRQLADRTASPKALLDLPSGSRLRLLIEARRQTYGDDVRLEWKCTRCGADNAGAASLADVDDVAYPDGLAPVEHTASDGVVYTFGWGTGHSELAFVRGVQRKQWGRMDEGLTRIAAVNGTNQGPRYFATLAANVCDELRAVARAMTPARYLPEVEPPTLAHPQGGPRMRVQVECDACGHTRFVALEAMPDFLYRGARWMADN